MSCSCCVQAVPPPSEEYHPFISTHRLAKKCPLDDKTLKSFTYSIIDTKSAHHTGSLVQMPVEIFQRILKNLDIETLFNVRLCSQYCRLAVTSILEWQEIFENAPEAFRAILSTKIGSNILLLQLHHALTNPECEFCRENSDFRLDGEKVLGGFLSLFEGKRACAYCLRNDLSLRAIEYIDLVRLTLRPDSAVKFRPDIKYPQLRTIPDRYGAKKYRVNRRMSLVSLGSIEMIPGKPLNAHDTRVLQRSRHEIIIPKHPFSNRVNMDYELAPHPGYVGFEREDEIARRYMTAIPFRYFGKIKTHPNEKKRVTFHSCKECFLQERYHEIQFLESFNQGEVDEMIIGCAGNIYKRETRLWLDDVKAEKRHARRFHESIGNDEQQWRDMIGAPVFNLKDPQVWKELRHQSYKEAYFTGE